MWNKFESKGFTFSACDAAILYPKGIPKGKKYESLRDLMLSPIMISPC